MTEPLIQILILAAISIFVLSRLYAALGKDEHRPDDIPAGAPKVSNEPSSPAESRPEQRAEPEIFTGQAAAGLTMIREADPAFDRREFLMGAKAAYEMIVAAYARGDRDALKPLLDDDVYEAWD